MTIGERPQVGTGFEFVACCTTASQTSHIDFVIEVANVADDGIVFHFRHVRDIDNGFVTCCSNENICLAYN